MSTRLSTQRIVSLPVRRRISTVGGAITDAWAPTDISGLQLWADARYQVYSDAGSTPAVNNDPVQQINDRSGNNRTWSQATLAKRGTYKTGVLNGQPGILFDGTDDFFDIATSWSLTDCTIFYVLKIPSDITSATAAQATLYTQAGGSAGDAACGLILGDTGLPSSEVCTQLAYTGAVDNKSYGRGCTSTMTAGAYIITSQLNGTSETIRHNGSALPLSTIGADGTLDSSDGARRYNQTAWRFGANPSGAANLSGHLFQCLVYDSALSGDHIALVESYLSDIYGIAV